jgi:alpha-glucosidase (family GH31 glycosyl hydrolase)
LPGSTWTDYFTGVTYPGGTTHDVTTTLDTMPVFIRSGGIVVTATSATAATATISAGSSGQAVLHDDGTITPLSYRETRGTHTVRIGPGHRSWTVRVDNTTAPHGVRVAGRTVQTWAYSPETRTLTITLPDRPARRPVTVTFH